MDAYGSGGVAPLIRNLGCKWRWLVSFAPQPLFNHPDTHWVDGLLDLHTQSGCFAWEILDLHTRSGCFAWEIFLKFVGNRTTIPRSSSPFRSHCAAWAIQSLSRDNTRIKISFYFTFLKMFLLAVREVFVFDPELGDIACWMVYFVGFHSYTVKRSGGALQQAITVLSLHKFPFMIIHECSLTSWPLEMRPTLSPETSVA